MELRLGSLLRRSRAADRAKQSGRLNQRGPFRLLRRFLLPRLQPQALSITYNERHWSSSGLMFVCAAPRMDPVAAPQSQTFSLFKSCQPLAEPNTGGHKGGQAKSKVTRVSGKLSQTPEDSRGCQGTAMPSARRVGKILTPIWVKSVDGPSGMPDTRTSQQSQLRS